MTLNYKNLFSSVIFLLGLNYLICNSSFCLYFTLLGRTLRPQYFMIRRYTIDNRKRNNQLKIYLTDEEKKVFEKK